MGTLTRRSYSISSLGDDYGSVGESTIGSHRQGAARKGSNKGNCHSPSKDGNKPNRGAGVTWKKIFTPPRSSERRRREQRERHVVTPPTAQAGIENVDNMSSTDRINPYSMLQIRKDATHAEIKQAYRRHALWHHPGRKATIGTYETSEQQRRQRVFMILAACCETLLERESRARLDLILKEPRNNNNNNNASSSHNNDHSRRHPRRPTFRSSASVSDIPILDLSQDYSTDSDDDDDDGSVIGWCGVWPYWRKSQESHESSPNKNGSTNPLRKSRPFVRAMSSGSTEEHDHIHYTKAETDRLFGGPLSLMYRARMFRPFSDPFAVFKKIFGSAVFPKPTNDEIGASISPCATPVRNPSTTPTRKTTTSPTRSPASPKHGAKPLQTTTKPRSSWTGSFEVLPGGTTVYTTCRILHGRKLIKQERITVDPVTGKKKSTITVTGEDIIDEETKTNMDGTAAAAGDKSKSQKAPKQNDSDSSFLDWLDSSCCGACHFSVTAEDHSFGWKRNPSDTSVIDNSSKNGGGNQQNQKHVRSDETNNSNREAIAVF